MTKQDFSELMFRLKTVYPNFRINENSLQAVWWEKLEPLRADIARLAVNQYTDSERFAPTPADIITRYRAIEELNKSRLRDLKDIFHLAQQNYPVQSEDDERAFMLAIKSESYDECRAKAKAILNAVLADPRGNGKSFAEYIGGRKW